MDHVPDPDLLIGGEDPIIPKELREALYSLDKEFREEKDRAEADFQQQLSRMRDTTFARVLTMLVEGGQSKEAIIDFVSRASQSLKSHRKSFIREDPKIQVFRRKTH